MRKNLLAIGMGLPMVMLLASRVFAHEGHGNPQWGMSVLHYLLEPQHAVVSVAVALGVVLLATRVVRRLAEDRRTS